MWFSDETYWGIEPPTAAEIRSREELSDVEDDWAVQPKGGPTRQEAEKKMCSWCEEHRLFWTQIMLKCEPKKEVIVYKKTIKIPAVAATTDVYKMVDKNAQERSSWIEWAKRRHPEWGVNPKTPHRLQPQFVKTLIKKGQEALPEVERVIYTQSSEEWDLNDLMTKENPNYSVKKEWATNGRTWQVTNIQRVKWSQVGYYQCSGDEWDIYWYAPKPN